MTGVSVTDSNGVSKGQVTYALNTAADTLTSILSGNGTRYRFTYDGLGRTTSTRIGTDSSYRSLASYLYNGDTGALQQLTYGNGHTLTYAYDALGRVSKKTPTNSSQRSEYVYNDKGRLGILKDYASDTRTKYLYDLAGRVTRVLRQRYANTDTGWRWGEILYRYEDGTNHLTRLQVNTDYQSYTTNFVYGSIGLGQMPDSVYEVKLNNTKEIQYTYDRLGRLTSRKLSVPNLTATYGYKTVNGNRTSTQVQSVTTAAGTTSYTYDDMGNIESVTKNGTIIEDYTYDALNQLTDATVNGVMYAYTYDAGGNILTAGAGGTTHTYTYGDSLWKDLLTAYDGNAITYDAIGNPLSYRNGMSFTWQNGRELAAVTKNGVTTSYVYNADGGRHTKTVGGVVTQYITVDGVLYGEKTGNNTLVYYYDDNGTPYAFTHNNVKYYYEYNMQGDVIGLFDSTGTRVVQYTYDPWGKLLSITGTAATTVGAINPFRYRGYYYDAETGFYYCNSRYYDPEIGRWINADAYVSTGTGVLGYNMFAYCNNNPVIYADPTGESLLLACAFLVATTFIACASPSGKARAEAVMTDPSLYNVGNWLTMGAFDTVKGAVAPEKPGSLQHWADSFATATMLLPAVGAVDDVVRSSASSAKNTTPKVSAVVSRGSTGRTEPSNLIEQLAMEQVKSNPSAGTPLTKITLHDPRWPSSEQWVKMQQIVPTSQGNINIHYVYNKALKIFDDFKFIP